MFDRIMVALFLIGGLGLAGYLYQNRYAADACNADAVTSSLNQQIQGQLGEHGLFFLNAKETEGSLFSRHRNCVVDAAPIVDAVPLGKSHWVKVHYAVSVGEGGAPVVTARLGSATVPTFAANQ